MPLVSTHQFASSPLISADLHDSEHLATASETARDCGLPPALPNAPEASTSVTCPSKVMLRRDQGALDCKADKRPTMMRLPTRLPKKEKNQLLQRVRTEI